MRSRAFGYAQPTLMVNPTDDLAPLARAALQENFGLNAGSLDDAALLLAIDRVLLGLPEGATTREFLGLLVDELPTPETALFQPAPLWEWLSTEILPGLVESSFSRGRPVKLASVGCAFGHEPFGLAMRVLERFASLGKTAAAALEHTRVVGYDVSARRLALARTGQVSAFSVQAGKPEWVRRWVQPEAAVPGLYRVHAAVAAMCRFEPANLLALATSEKLRLRGVDVLLCQHVLSDFHPDAARRALGLLAEALPVGAVVVVSPDEAHLLEGWARLSLTGYAAAATVVKADRPTPPERFEKSAPAAAAPMPEAAAVDLRALLSARAPPVAADDGARLMRHARLVLLLAPDHLLARLLLAQRLLPAQPVWGRAMLEALLATADRLPPASLAPHGRGLTVEQVASAAQQLFAAETSR